MTNKNKNIDPIPEEFNSYEEAAEFWDNHETTDYLDHLQPVEVLESELRYRHHEIEVDEDLIPVLEQQAQKRGVPLKTLANEILRKQLQHNLKGPFIT